jgi:hypothetical protein
MPLGPFSRSGASRAADLRLRSSASRPSLEVQLSAKRKADEITSILHGPIGVDDERRLISLLRDAEELELDPLLWRLDAAHLLSSIYDYGSSRHRTELVELLTRERLADLGIANRARLIGVLHTGAAHRGDERGIASVLLGTRDHLLTQLKNAVDSEPESVDLHQLIFHDIHHDEVRDAILGHIRESAPATTDELKVVSDVDDTVLAWRDRRFPARTTYPGVVEFYRQLASRPYLGVQRRSDLVFLTARPTDGLGAVEGLTIRALRQCGLRGIVVTGELTALRRHDLMAQKKYESFSRYRQLYPESRMVFIGDNGQGDLILAERLCTEHREVVPAALIHNVDHGERQITDTGRAALHAKGIVLFDTYVGAAVEAYELALITWQGLAAVARAAEAELEAVRFDDPQRAEAARALIARDCERAGRLSKTT